MKKYVYTPNFTFLKKQIANEKLKEKTKFKETKIIVEYLFLKFSKADIIFKNNMIWKN